MFGDKTTASYGMLVDIIISNATILTMNAHHKIIEGGAVVINNGVILDICEGSMETKYTAKRLIDAAGDIVMPGMINGHTHVPMTLFRGLGVTAKDIIFDVMFPLEKEFVTPHFVYWGTMLGAAEMLLGGVTTFADMYYFEDEVARASKELGMRAVLGETIMRYPTADAKVPYGGIDVALKFIEMFKNDPLITPAFAPHAPYTVDGEQLQKVNQLATEYNAPVLMHLAERDAAFEIGQIPDTRGLTAIDYLEKLGILNDQWIYAHCNQASQQDIAKLKKSGAGVVHNAVSNLMCCLPAASAFHMHQEQLNVGLGTDGAMSGGTQDLISHLRYVHLLQREKLGDPTRMDERDVVELATMGGARALGMADQIGSIEIGKKADIIIVATSQAHNLSNINPYSALVYSSHPSDVRCSIIDGKLVVDERRLVNVELATIIAETRKITQSVKEWCTQHFPASTKVPSSEIATQVKKVDSFLTCARTYLPTFSNKTVAAAALGASLIVTAMIQYERTKPAVCGP